MPSPDIAFDVTPLQNAHSYRGIGTYVRGLATRLAAQDSVPIEFWGWEGDPPLNIGAPHRASWLPRFRMPEYRGAWMFAQFAMRRRAARSPVRAVHITDPDALITLGSRTLLTTVYDLIPLKEGISRRRLLTWLGYRSYLGTLRRASTLFAISNETANDIDSLLQVPRSRIVVAPPGIDARTAPSLDDPVRPYFLYIGGPNPNKNLALLLDAMAICTDLAEELLIAGQWLPKQVSALMDELDKTGLVGRVRHLRFVSDSNLTSLMRNATALVVPSRFEGFGLPVGEGLAVGAAVIHSRIPVLEEVSNGAALTFDPSSAEELASCLRQIARDKALRDRMRARGVERAKLLTWDAAVARTLATYEAVTRA